MEQAQDHEPVDFYSTNVWYVGDCLRLFFEGDHEKITAWWFTPNPGLGNIAPVAMVVMGRDKRLAKFVQTAMTDNPSTD